MRTLKLSPTAVLALALAAGLWACEASKPSTDETSRAAPASESAATQPTGAEPASQPAAETPSDSQPSDTQPATRPATEQSDASSDLLGNTTVVVLPTTGMTCEACEQAIKTTLERLPGVQYVNASHQVGTTTVAFVPGVVDVARLVETVNTLGYQASPPSQ